MVDTIFRGDSATFELTFTDSAGAAVDISATVIWYTIKKYITDPDTSALLQTNYTFPSNATSANGIGTLVLTVANTNIVPGTYTQEFQWVNGTTVKTLEQSSVLIKQDATVSIA